MAALQVDLLNAASQIGSQKMRSASFCYSHRVVPKSPSGTHWETGCVLHPASIYSDVIADVVIQTQISIVSLRVGKLDSALDCAFNTL